MQVFHPVWLLGRAWVFLHCSLMELELELRDSILLERQWNSATFLHPVSHMLLLSTRQR